MKLDPTVMRSMNAQDYRVLEAVEKGMKNHALVPPALISNIANLRHGGTNKIISHLLRDKLLSHERRKNSKYDGYRLTNAGYDVLALHTLRVRKIVCALGDRIGTGKESDVYLGIAYEDNENENGGGGGEQVVLKLHRLGRTSFRNVRKKRDYFSNASNNKSQEEKKNNSWLFLSRLSALKEYSFMKALYDVGGYPVPQPIGHNRHIVVMSLVRGAPLYQIIPNRISIEQAESIFDQTNQLAIQLAKHGLIHCDLNEFNLLVDMSGVQAQIADEHHDPYVRHSGMSVTSTTSKGTLSGKLLHDNDMYDDRQHEQDGYYQQHHQQEEKEKLLPKFFLSNGDPKPVVTLIDFPQMVSTQHPNAKELFQRDLYCLQKFFESKLKCSIPEEELLQHMSKFESIMKKNYSNNNNNSNNSDNTTTDAITTGGGAITTDSSNNDRDDLQARLDIELKASGYSKEDGARDLELYYYNSVVDPAIVVSSSTANNTPILEEEEEDGEESNNDNDNDNANNNNNSVNENYVNSSDGDDKSCHEDENNHYNEQRYEDDDDINNDLNSINNKSDNNDNGVNKVVIQNLSLENEAGAIALEKKVKRKVRKQIQEQKRKGRQTGTSRNSRNNNKHYEKGKRVNKDYGF